MASRLFILGGVAAAVYVFSSQDTSIKEENPEGVVGEPTCPDGYILSTDKQSCLLGDADSLLVQPENPCPPGYRLSDDGTECVSEKPDLNINTGSVIGDMAANIGITIGTGLGLQGIGIGIGKALTPRASLAAVAAASAAKFKAQAASSAAAAAERKAAQTAASKATQIAERKAAQVAAAKATMLAAKSAKAAAIAAKATKATSLMSRAAAGPGFIFSILFTALAQSLIALLDLRPGSFESCKNGEYDLSTLPNWAQAIIGGFPFVGDVFDMFSPVLCFQGGCSDPDSENQNGLCYPMPKPGYKCEAFECYKQYPEWENNGMLHTLLNITKAIKMDTGTIPDTPPPGTIQSGLLYYADPGPDFNVVAGVAWEKCKPGMTDTGVRCENVYGNGIGRIP